MPPIFVAAALCSGLIYAWLAPYSSEFGIFLVEIPLLLLFLAVLTLMVGIAAWALRHRIVFPARFWAVLLVGAWMGVALAVYLYPPDARQLPPSSQVTAAAETLCQRFLEHPPWHTRIDSSPGTSCESRVTESAKGLFGWTPPYGWSAHLGFRYANGINARLSLWLRKDTYYRFQRLTVIYPPTLPPEWASHDLANWQPQLPPWQWAVEATLEQGTPAIRRQRLCNATQDCAPDAPDAYWRFDIRQPDGKGFAWTVHPPTAGVYEEEFLFFGDRWTSP